MPESTVTRRPIDDRDHRWRVLVPFLIFLIATAVTRLPWRKELATHRMPTSQNLSIGSLVHRGPGSPSMLAPHVSVIAPDGRKSGFDRGSGTIQHAVPGMYRRGERSARSEEDFLLVGEVEDGTYVVEVTGTATGTYNLNINAGGTSSTQLLTSAARRLHDIPIAEGAVHRYEVKYAHDRDATALPTIIAIDAPAPTSSTSTVSESATLPPRLSISIRNGCDSGPPGSVRLRTPGGRGAGYDRTGATHGDDVPGLRIADSQNGFTITNVVDGEYVLEIFPTETATSYYLHVDLLTPTMHYDVQPQTINCTRTTVAPGQVHRWTIRLAQSADFPMRVIWPGPNAEDRP